MKVNIVNCYTDSGNASLSSDNGDTTIIVQLPEHVVRRIQMTVVDFYNGKERAGELLDGPAVLPPPNRPAIPHTPGEAFDDDIPF